MNWDYIAGFFDADGTCGFFIRHNNMRTFIEFKNTNIDVLLEIQKFLGYGKIYTYKQASPSQKKVSSLNIIRYSKQLDFLSYILDKLIVKKERGQKVLEWLLNHPIAERKTSRKKGDLLWCPQCKQYLPKENFHRDRHNKLYRRCGYCKKCANRIKREKYHSHVLHDKSEKKRFGKNARKRNEKRIESVCGQNHNRQKPQNQA